MAYNNRSKRRRRKLGRSGVSHKLLGSAIVAVALVMLSGFAYLNHKATSDRGGIDAKFCRKNGMSQVTVVLVDHTDRMSAVQRSSLEKHLWDVATSIPKNSAIRVFSVARVQEHILKPDVDLCNPGSGDDVNEMVANRQIVQKKYESQFRQPLSDILEQTLQSGTADESPIMEAVQSVVVSNFIGDGNIAPIKRLIVVSDLLEHTNEFSLYKGVPDFASYKKSSHWQTVRSKMNDVQVEIFFLHRKG